MKVLTNLVGKDNYMYIIHDSNGNAAAVDPLDYRKVHEIVSEKNLNLTHVLTTHHHHDHAGGNEGLLLSYPELIVVSYDHRTKGSNMLVKDGSFIEIGSILIKCIHTPGHTSDSICYFATDTDDDQKSKCVFTGDTLFIGGCGRLFEGTPFQMHDSLSNKLSLLPPETEVFCGHEYTVQNLQFGISIEPDNFDMIDKLEESIASLKNGIFTVPSTIANERNHNIFLRTNDIVLLKTYELSMPVDLFGKLRQLKDGFKN